MSILPSNHELERRRVPETVAQQRRGTIATAVNRLELAARETLPVDTRSDVIAQNAFAPQIPAEKVIEKDTHVTNGAVPDMYKSAHDEVERALDAIGYQRNPLLDLESMDA